MSNARRLTAGQHRLLLGFSVALVLVLALLEFPWTIGFLTGVLVGLLVCSAYVFYRGGG